MSAALGPGRSAILLVLLLPVAAPGRVEPEPFDARGGSWWIAASPDLVLDPVRGELRPWRAEQETSATYQFKVQPGDATLRLSYLVRLGGSGDRARWEVSWDGLRFAPAADHTWRSGPQQVDLTRYLSASRPLYVRLVLYAAERPERVAVSGLAWDLEGLVRVRAVDRLPVSCWLYPAWAVLHDRRVAPGLPPGREVETGLGRRAGPLQAVWQPDGDAGRGWQAVDWQPPRPDPGRTRLLVAPTGPDGGRLTLNGQLLAEHAVPWLPVGCELSGDLAALAPPALMVEGVPRGADVRQISTGPLEVRYCRSRVEWQTDGGCDVWLELVVVNHAAGEVEGGVAGRLTAPDGSLAAVAAAGYRYPPGPWLAPLVFHVERPLCWDRRAPRTYRAAATIDDGRAVSDAAELAVALKQIAPDGDSWRLNGTRLMRVETSDRAPEAAVRALAGGWNGYLELPAPVPPTALDLAEELAVPLLILCDPARPELRPAEELRCAGRPPVLAVITRG